jgi:hypothetical protein
VLRQIGAIASAPFQTSPRVHRSQHFISCNLLLLVLEHVRPLPTRSLDSCSPLAPQLCLRPKIRCVLFSAARAKDPAQLNDSFTTPVNIPKTPFCRVKSTSDLTKLCHILPTSTPPLTSSRRQQIESHERRAETKKPLRLRKDASDNWTSTIGTCPSYSLRCASPHPINTKHRCTAICPEIICIHLNVAAEYKRQLERKLISNLRRCRLSPRTFLHRKHGRSFFIVIETMGKQYISFQRSRNLGAMAECTLDVTKTTWSNINTQSTLDRHCAVEQPCNTVLRGLAYFQAPYSTSSHILQTD